MKIDKLTFVGLSLVGLTIFCSGIHKIQNFESILMWLLIGGCVIAVAVFALQFEHVGKVRPDMPYLQPTVEHAEIFWPGHGNGPDYETSGGFWPTLDIYISANHAQHVQDMFPFGKPPGTRLTIIDDNQTYRYEIPLDDSKFSDTDLSNLDTAQINSHTGTYLRDDHGIIRSGKTPDGMRSTWADRERSLAVDWARAFGYNKGLPEIGSPEDRFTGGYGS